MVMLRRASGHAGIVGAFRGFDRIAKIGRLKISCQLRDKENKFVINTRELEVSRN
jgi:hypothetical protein